MLTKSWLLDAGERALKTIIQTALAALGLDGISHAISASLTQVIWLALAAGVVSLLTSVVSAGVGSTGTASLTDAVIANPAEDQ